jgi:hypothetical protein
MLTKQLRELERQASVIEKHNILKKHFVKMSDVTDYLEFKVVKPTLVSVIKSLCTKYINKDGELFYDKEEVKNLVIIHLFKDLETEITTYIPSNPNDIKTYNPFKG